MTYSLRLLCIFAVGTVAAFGHEVATHRNIGDVAVAYLQQSAPTRPLLPSLQPLLLIGASQEDLDPLPQTLGGKVGNAYRYFFHFTPSINFVSSIGNASSSCASTQWGLQDLACTAICNIFIPIIGTVCSGSGTDLNQFRWSQDLTADTTTGAPSFTSIKQFGYVVHLLEDLESPAHTRNDIHPCRAGV